MSGGAPDFLIGTLDIVQGPLSEEERSTFVVLALQETLSACPGHFWVIPPLQLVHGGKPPLPPLPQPIWKMA
jgi:hypothetical protein